MEERADVGFIRRGVTAVARPPRLRRPALEGEPHVGRLPSAGKVAHAHPLGRDAPQALVADAVDAREAQPTGHLGRALVGQLDQPRLAVVAAAQLRQRSPGCSRPERSLREVAE
jgi:hypothetical protein